MDGPNEEKTEKPKTKYPRAVFFIAGFELSQRFCLYTMRTVLSIYLVYWLDLHEYVATVVYHLFNVVQYITPILGGIIADNWLGNYKTIIFGSVFYSLGIITILISSIPDIIITAVLTYLGLFMTALGHGIVAPCVNVFGGDQFVFPEQKDQQQTFFSVTYVAVCVASFIATIISPILRTTECLGSDSCYPLSFGISSVFILLSFVIFISGKSFYKIKAPHGDIVVQVSKCVAHGVKMRVKNRKGEKKEHWLDHAADKFDPKLIADTKLGLKVLKMFLTVPFFWALYDQKGSRWTFQATRMLCDFGSWKVQPDQMQILSPLLIMIMAPVFEVAIFPVLKKLKVLQTPLKKMVLGGVLAGVAFLLSAGVEVAIDSTDAVTPFKGEAQLRLLNSLDCNIGVSSDVTGDFQIPPMQSWQNVYIPVQTEKIFNLKATAANECGIGTSETEFEISLFEKQAQSYTFHDGIAPTTLKLSNRYLDSTEKSRIGSSRVRIVLNSNVTTGVPVTLRGKKVHSIIFVGEISESGFIEIDSAEYQIEVDQIPIGKAYFGGGGVYTLQINRKISKFNVITITPANMVNVFWQVPQYFTMAIGEMLFSITGLGFAFTQAPKSMKTLIMSGWLIAVAVGNIVVIGFAGAQIFKKMLWEYVLFAGLMFLSMVVFAVQAVRYTYVEIPSDDEESEKKDEEDSKTKYPRAIFFIAGFELSQRFGFYTMRTVLSIYLVHWLGLEEYIATMVFHLFTVIQYISPVLGGIIADNWLGNYKTILFGSIFYSLGIVAVLVSSIPDIIITSILTFLGLFLTATGKGIVAPCINVFGGDQFVFPEQRDEPQKFFSVMYVAVNVANFIAIIISPILRTTDCLGNDSCYPLSFGISSIFILLSFVIFVGGKSFYKLDAPKGDVVVQVSKCVAVSME
ncbi:Hypothetical predicted protein [Cloeon dipterum]|uniref:Oligopeptide transporter 1 n=1 Tax=Cloeon dipterum TaxID=197152 RepID=A0A8S1D0N3_9INSE|nr:Hypothetical predicted protein [Cloeon dipterum]